MRFSIIVPTFNSKGFLHRCMTSLAEQDFPNADFEILLVDDASTDGTAEYAKTLQERLPNLRVLSLAVNGGPGAARNKGLKHAKGEWVLFLDSDDELAPNCLSSLARFIDRNGEELGAVGFDWTSTISDPGLNSSKRVGRRDGEFLGNRDRLIRQYLAHRMDGSVIYTAIRRSILDAFDIRFAHGLHEDVDFIFKVYCRAPGTAYLDEVLYRKRNRDRSIINTISERHINGYFRAWTAIGDYLDALDLPQELRRAYDEHYHYGSVGAIATRVREVVRHCADERKAADLFLLIYGHANTLFKDGDLHQALKKARTVYFIIAETFLRAMEDSNLSDIDKAGFIKRGVNEMAGKSWSCVDLHHSVFLRPDQVRTCCKRFFVDGEMRGDVVLFEVPPMPTAPISSNAVLAAKRGLHQKINAGEPTPCDGCPFLEFREWTPLNQLEIKYLSLEYHSVCNLECTYCSEEYFGGKSANYNIRQTIESLLHGRELEDCAIVVWGGGEPVIDKNFEYLLGLFAKALPHAQQRVLTNSVKRSPVLEMLLAERRAQIVTSVDAGSNETFKAVRGRDNLDKVLKNLKAYATINPSRVTIKYIFTEGNSSVDEVRQFVSLMQGEGLLRCNFQISGDFKRETINEDVAAAMVLMFGWLRKAGCQVVYFDELLRHRLVAAINVDDPAQIDRIHRLAGFDFIATPARYPRVVIWGAGQQAKYLMEGSAFLKSSEVAFFVDATPEKVGSQFYGKTVCSPSTLISTDLPVVVAAVQGYPLILEQYRSLGLPECRLIKDLII